MSSLLSFSPNHFLKAPEVTYIVIVRDPRTKSVLKFAKTTHSQPAVQYWQQMHPFNDPSPISRYVRSFFSLNPPAHPITTGIPCKCQPANGCYGLEFHIIETEEVPVPQQNRTKLGRTIVTIATQVNTLAPPWIDGKQGTIDYSYYVFGAEAIYCWNEEKEYGAILNTQAETLSKGKWCHPVKEGPFNLESLEIDKLIPMEPGQELLPNWA